MSFGYYSLNNINQAVGSGSVNITGQNPVIVQQTLSSANIYLYENPTDTINFNAFNKSLNVNNLVVNGSFVGTTGAFSNLQVNTMTGGTGYFTDLSAQSMTGATCYFDTYLNLPVDPFNIPATQVQFSDGTSSTGSSNFTYSNDILSVQSMTGGSLTFNTGTFQLLSTQSMTGGSLTFNTGTFQSLSVQSMTGSSCFFDTYLNLPQSTGPSIPILPANQVYFSNGVSQTGSSNLIWNESTSSMSLRNQSGGPVYLFLDSSNGNSNISFADGGVSKVRYYYNNGYIVLMDEANTHPYLFGFQMTGANEFRVCSEAAIGGYSFIGENTQNNKYYNGDSLQVFPSQRNLTSQDTSLSLFCGTGSTSSLNFYAFTGPFNNRVSTNQNFIRNSNNTLDICSSQVSSPFISMSNDKKDSFTTLKRLDFGGSLYPDVDITHNIGTYNKRWNKIYATDLFLSNSSLYFGGTGTTDSSAISAAQGVDVSDPNLYINETGANVISTDWFVANQGIVVSGDSIVQATRLYTGNLLLEELPSISTGPNATGSNIGALGFHNNDYYGWDTNGLAWNKLAYYTPITGAYNPYELRYNNTLDQTTKVIADIYNIQDTNSSLLNQTGAQSLFKSPHTTVEFSEGLYNFNGVFAFLTNNTSKTVSFQMTPTTGTIENTVFIITTNGFSSTGSLVFSQQSVGFLAQGGTGPLNIAPSSSATTYRCFYQGNIWVSNNTKIQPSISMSALPGGSAIIAGGSYISFRQLSSSSTTYSQGNWS
jgi:hypothetical protein